MKGDNKLSREAEDGWVGEAAIGLHVFALTLEYYTGLCVIACSKSGRISSKLPHLEFLI